MLDVAEQLGADVAAAAAEERGPVALGAVDALELRRVGDLVAEDEGDQRAGTYRFESADGCDPHGRQGARRAHPRARRGGGARARQRRARRPCSSATTRRPTSTSGSSTRPRPRPGCAPSTCGCRQSTARGRAAREGRRAERRRRRSTRCSSSCRSRPASTRSASSARSTRAKDVDGLHPRERRRAAARADRASSRRPRAACWRCCASTTIELDGARGGRDRPQRDRRQADRAAARCRRNATVTVCHSHTRDLGGHTRAADVLVVAIGVPAIVTADMVKPGAAVIDVGINRTDDGVVGDVDPAAAEVAALPDAGARRRRADDDRMSAGKRRYLRPHRKPAKWAVSIHFEQCYVQPASRPS